MATRILISTGGNSKPFLTEMVKKVWAGADVVCVWGDNVAQFPEEDNVFDVILFSAYAPRGIGTGLGPVPDWQSPEERMQEEVEDFFDLLLKKARPGGLVIPISSVQRWRELPLRQPQKKVLVATQATKELEACLDRLERNKALHEAIRSS